MSWGDCGPQPSTGDIEAYIAWENCVNAQAGLRLYSFTGDCNTPNYPDFNGWATFADAVAWCHACTSSQCPDATPAPKPPPATPSAPTPHSLSFDGGGGIGSYCDEFWDDPLCSLWSTGGIPIGGGGGGTTIEQPIIIQEGLSAFDVNTAIDTGLDTVWSAVVAGIDALLALAISAIQTALTALGNAQKAAYATNARQAGYNLNLQDTMLRKVTAGIIAALKDVRAAIKAIYDDVLKPLLGVLGSLRQRLLDLYQRFLRPMLIVLQDIRRVLGILAAFHVPFAQKLDLKLADLERRISAPLLLLLQYTNAVANWLNLISTANYLFQKPMWMGSLRAYAGSTINAQLNAINHPVDPAALAASQQAAYFPSAKQSVYDFNEWATTGQGNGAADVNNYSAQFATILQTGV